MASTSALAIPVKMTEHCGFNCDLNLRGAGSKWQVIHNGQSAVVDAGDVNTAVAWLSSIHVLTPETQDVIYADRFEQLDVSQGVAHVQSMGTSYQYPHASIPLNPIIQATLISRLPYGRLQDVLGQRFQVLMRDSKMLIGYVNATKIEFQGGHMYDRTTITFVG